MMEDADEVNESKVKDEIFNDLEIIKSEQCDVVDNLNGLNSVGAVVQLREAAPVEKEAGTEVEVGGGKKCGGDTGDTHEVVEELKLEAEVEGAEKCDGDTCYTDEAVAVTEFKEEVADVAAEGDEESVVVGRMEERLVAEEGGEERLALDEGSVAVGRKEESLVAEEGGEERLPFDEGSVSVGGMEGSLVAETVRDRGEMTVLDDGNVQTFGAELVVGSEGDKEGVVGDSLGGADKVVSDIGVMLQLDNAESAKFHQVSKGGEELEDVEVQKATFVEKDDKIEVAQSSDIQVQEAFFVEKDDKIEVAQSSDIEVQEAFFVEKDDRIEVAQSLNIEVQETFFAAKDDKIEVVQSSDIETKTVMEAAMGNEENLTKEAPNDESLVGEAQLEEKNEVRNLSENLVWDNRLESEKGVDMDLEESNDTNLEDSPYNLADTLMAAERSENEEAEAREEIEMEDETEIELENTEDEEIGMEDETEVELENMETTTDNEGEGLDELDSPKGPQDEVMVAEEETAMVDAGEETETDVEESKEAAGAKRKRGKISRTPANSKIAAKSSKTTEEDVCFICFDGGSLVLCDRRGCPKAYHPSCVNRDEAFFHSKGRWNCGWHLCSICEKNAHYMCYTCTFSLCKGCIKDSVILCVRGNKGFCETCMRSVMLIENNEQGKKDDEINFDDKNSWEYLFKDYYTDLKLKLSLSSFEVAEAKNPWKGSSSFSRKQDKAPTGINKKVSAGKQESPEAQVDAKNDGGIAPRSSSEIVETGKSKRRKVKKQSKTSSKGDDSRSEDNSSPGATEWASKELLEFVMHMKNGDKSVLSQYDVQTLLLEYIKRNNRRDPRQKSRIICDSRLQNLFGKPRVGHFEMLKLLESHFLVKENSQPDSVQGNVTDTEVDQLEADESADTLTKGVKDRKRKTRKKGGRRGPQSNLDDYAAIDLHNISLIFLRRKLMEDLLEDVETFHDKVVGTFVRIRISGSVQKQDLYRLVQVVGTSKAAEPYKVGKRTANIMLEILNLNKTEIISVDSISNQDFTEDECKRLRQSIKCGLINRMTVGEFLDKAMELQTTRVTDYLESEIVRLSHLCDRASEKGRKKELRECVEKLQLLKTPEERLRRLEEVPEIHADPKMDPSYESEEEAIEEVYTKTRGSGSRGGRGQISPGSDFFSKDSWSGRGKYPSKNWGSEENGGHIGEILSETSWNQGRDQSTRESNDMENKDSVTNSETFGWNKLASKSESLVAVSTITSSSPPSVRVVETAFKINESEKMWRYQDPSGKVQGPFSMVQLRKWNNSGYFPADLKVWRTIEKQDKYILLSDALAGNFQELAEVDNKFAASTLLNPQTLSVNTANNIEMSLKKAREDQHGEKLKAEQNNTIIIHKGSPRELTTPSHDLPKISKERWSPSYPSNLPSPTPKPTSADWTGDMDPRANPISFSAGGSVKGPGNDSMNSSIRSSIGSSVAPNSSENYLQNSQPVVTAETHSVQMQSHLVTPQHLVAPPVQSVNSKSTLGETLGWSSSPVQKVEANPFNPVPGQPQAYQTWGNVHAHAENIPSSVTTSVPHSELWRPTHSSQPNMQPPPIANMPWAENMPPAQVPRPENPNFTWGPVQGSPNMGWMAAAPANGNMNLGTSIQGPPGASVPGQVPANANPGWAATATNPAVQGFTPGSSNQNWVAPPIQGQVPGWAPPGGNVGATPQGPVPGNTNQGWRPQAANQGMWRSEQNHTGDRGLHGGNSSYGSSRPWNRQSSFGNGGPGGSSRNFLKGIPCAYNKNGQCKKGAACDYLHN